MLCDCGQPTRVASGIHAGQVTGNEFFGMIMEETLDCLLLEVTHTVQGDLNGQANCALPQTIPAGCTYCGQVTVSVSGNAGDSVTNVATSARKPFSESGTARVLGRTPTELPPAVPEAPTRLPLGSAVSGLAAYAGLQIRSRRRR
ncbi:hypothetical protein ACFLYD_00490 [Chloroflexota bacterium]